MAKVLELLLLVVALSAPIEGVAVTTKEMATKAAAAFLSRSNGASPAIDLTKPGHDSAELRGRALYTHGYGDELREVSCPEDDSDDSSSSSDNDDDESCAEVYVDNLMAEDPDMDMICSAECAPLIFDMYLHWYSSDCEDAAMFGDLVNNIAALCPGLPYCDQSTECFRYWVNDGECDPQCSSSACDRDGDDCSSGTPQSDKTQAEKLAERMQEASSDVVCEDKFENCETCNSFKTSCNRCKTGFTPMTMTSCVDMRQSLDRITDNILSSPAGAIGVAFALLTAAFAL